MLLDPENVAYVGLPSSMRHANGWHRFQRGRLLGTVVIPWSHCDGWCRIVVAVNGNTRTFSEQVIASIIEDSRCGMSVVAFHTAPPIGGLSC